MYPNQYQNQYPNQFGGFQNHVIKPPIPMNGKKNQNSSGFWLGFLGGIITAILIGVGIEVFRRLKTNSKINQASLPNPAKEELETSKANTVKTIAEKVPNPLEVSKPIEKQTFNDFLEFLESIGFQYNQKLSEVTGKEIWEDENGNEIHIGAFDLMVKGIDKKPVTFSKKDVLFLETNKNLQNYLNNEN